MQEKLREIDQNATEFASMKYEAAETTQKQSKFDRGGVKPKREIWYNSQEPQQNKRGIKFAEGMGKT